MAEPFIVRREVQIAAPPATVFAFLTDPEKILRWMGAGATVEPHLDGLYLVNVNGRDTAEGRFTEVIPVHRLAYSFGWKEHDRMPPGSSLIEIDLIEREGGTQLRMTHSGLPDAALCADHDEGWGYYLARLAVAAAGGDPGRDRRCEAR
ncbi:MAG: SRPBCC family protein [Roseiarcus sp.]